MPGAISAIWIRDITSTASPPVCRPNPTRSATSRPSRSAWCCDKEMVASSALGAGASEAGRNAAMAAIADLKAGKPIFVGEVKSNTGKIIISKDTGLYDPSLEATDYLVEGIVGSV